MKTSPNNGTLPYRFLKSYTSFWKIYFVENLLHDSWTKAGKELASSKEEIFSILNYHLE